MGSSLRTCAAVLLAGGLLTAAPSAAASAPAAPTVTVAARVAVDPATDPSGPTGIELRADSVLPPVLPGRAHRRIQKYPGKVIRYWADVPKSYQWAVRTAAASWNRTGLDMTFKPSTRAKSDLTIEVDNIGFEGGLATLGYAPRRYRWVKLSPGMMGAQGFGGGFSVDERRVYTMHIAAHELGHTLGLGHRRTRCGLMGPILWIGDCEAWTTEPGHYNCQVVDAADLGRAVGLYGGRRTLAPEECPLDALPPALSDVTIEGGGPDGGPALISWDPPRNAPPGTEVQVLRRTGTSCDFAGVGNRKTPPRLPAAVSVTRVPLDGGPVTFSGDGDFCFGVRAVNMSGAGAVPTIKMLTLQALPPGPPDATGVVRIPDGSYRITLGDDPPFGQELLALVRPKGQCASGTWPAEEDPYDHVADNYGEGYEIWDEDIPQACVTVYLIDGRGRIGPGVALQAAAAPAPPKPVLTDVSLRPDEETIRFHTSVDTDRFELVPVVADTCFTTWDDDLSSEWPWTESGWWYVYYYDEHPCLSVFTRNADGVYSAGTTHQL